MPSNHNIAKCRASSAAANAVCQLSHTIGPKRKGASCKKRSDSARPPLASDTTPLFLMMLGMYRRAVGEPDFLADAADKALAWMDHQSPSDRVMVAQLPTTDWRDEQWILGFGLYVNTIVYAYLRLMGRQERKANTS